MGTPTPFPLSDTVTELLIVQLCSLLSQSRLDNLPGQLWYQAKTAKLKPGVSEHVGSLSESLSVHAKVFINV